MKERLLKYWTEHYKSNTNALQFNEVAQEECAATTVTEKTLKISTSFSQLTTYTGVDIEEGGWGLRKPPLTKRSPPPPSFCIWSQWTTPTFRAFSRQHPPLPHFHNGPELKQLNTVINPLVLKILNPPLIFDQMFIEGREASEFGGY